MEGRKELYNRLTFSAAVDFIASQKQVASRCDEKKKKNTKSSSHSFSVLRAKIIID